MGHYSKDKDGNIIAEEKLINTGSNSNYSVKNIFDLAGNCNEWIRLVNLGPVNVGSNYSSYNGGIESFAIHGYGANPLAAIPNFNSSRLQLYIK